MNPLDLNVTVMLGRRIRLNAIAGTFLAISLLACS